METFFDMKHHHHALVPFGPGQLPVYYPSVMCSVCSGMGIHKNVYWHCWRCEYDICMGCMLSSRNNNNVNNNNNNNNNNNASSAAESNGPPGSSSDGGDYAGGVDTGGTYDARPDDEPQEEPQPPCDDAPPDEPPDIAQQYQQAAYQNAMFSLHLQQQARHEKIMHRILSGESNPYRGPL